MDIMKKISVLLGSVFLSLGIFSGCGKEDPGYSKNDFAAEVATASCRWVYACCDSSEQKDYLKVTQDESACVKQITTQYLDLYSSADPKIWNSQEAKACTGQIQESSKTCPKAYDPAVAVDKCPLVNPTKNPGDSCATTWECTTKFCRLGTCANPITEGNSCQGNEPCAGDLRCINGVCKALQPDNAVCTQGRECYSGACGGGKCIVSSTYTCDGR
jgi:hypothetical protein